MNPSKSPPSVGTAEQLEGKNLPSAQAKAKFGHLHNIIPKNIRQSPLD